MLNGHQFSAGPGGSQRTLFSDRGVYGMVPGISIIDRSNIEVRQFKVHFCPHRLARTLMKSTTSTVV